MMSPHPTATSSESNSSTKTTLRSIFSPRMLVVFFMGFSSGLPLLLIGSTLKFWMAQSHVDLTVIGVFSIVGLPYTLKILWSPLLDRYNLLRIGRRRGWLLASQVALVGLLCLLSQLNPARETWAVAFVALLIALTSATQDTAVDAYRREILTTEELGLGSSLYVNGYRIALLIAGAFALFLADHTTWSRVYLVMAGFMSVGIITTFACPEPQLSETKQPVSIREAYLEPLKEFFLRDEAWVILIFILLYKIGESMASEMYSPFYVALHYSGTQVAEAAKLFGFWATIIGGLLGGVVMLRWGIARSLIIFGLLQGIALFGFSLLAVHGHSMSGLAGVVGAENFTSGMATTAYMAFMANLCDMRYTATQYALLTSLMGVPRVFAGSTTGWLALHLGWPLFFAFCAFWTIPAAIFWFKIRDVADQGMILTA